MKVSWVVSHSDVEKHPEYYEGLTRWDLERILQDYGMATSLGFQEDLRYTQEKPEDWPEEEEHFGYTHRSPFTGEVTLGPRYVGRARTDGEWESFVAVFLNLGGDCEIN